MDVAIHQVGEFTTKYFLANFIFVIPTHWWGKRGARTKIIFPNQEGISWTCDRGRMLGCIDRKTSFLVSSF